MREPALERGPGAAGDRLGRDPGHRGDSAFVSHVTTVGSARATREGAAARFAGVPTSTVFGMNMVKVALAEDNVLLREGISRLVAANKDFELVGVASDLPQLLSLAADAAFTERFNREARVLARLNHPNIVTVFDFGQSGEFFFLLMEFVDGVNLRQAMQGHILAQPLARLERAQASASGLRL